MLCLSILSQVNLDCIMSGNNLFDARNLFGGAQEDGESLGVTEPSLLGWLYKTKGTIASFNSPLD